MINWQIRAESFYEFHSCVTKEIAYKHLENLEISKTDFETEKGTWSGTTSSLPTIWEKQNVIFLCHTLRWKNKSTFFVVLVKSSEATQEMNTAAVGLGPGLQPSAPDGIVIGLLSLFCCTSFPCITCLCLCGEEFTWPQKAQGVYNGRDRKMSSLQAFVLLEL